MTIQFNTDNNIAGKNELETHLTTIVADKLGRFSEHLTRLEIHLSDEDGSKNGQNSIRCLLEARMEGRQPIAVNLSSNTSEQAVEGAIEKLKAALETIIGRMNN
ncbi:ribosome-associated translation inhibitor RaiA [Pedobacter sp. CG_S7]|uniref:HPF/RaiA family ribosome-associated protein n=1 Tax=Pedobacter sp. CG_S7 TaxID=3143930 RepID=UPI0033978165